MVLCVYEKKLIEKKSTVILEYKKKKHTWNILVNFVDWVHCWSPMARRRRSLYEF